MLWEHTKHNIYHTLVLEYDMCLKLSVTTLDKKKTAYKLDYPTIG